MQGCWLFYKILSVRTSMHSTSEFGHNTAYLKAQMRRKEFVADLFICLFMLCREQILNPLPFFNIWKYFFICLTFCLKIISFWFSRTGNEITGRMLVAYLPGLKKKHPVINLAQGKHQVFHRNITKRLENIEACVCLFNQEEMPWTKISKRYISPSCHRNMRNAMPLEGGGFKGNGIKGI